MTAALAATAAANPATAGPYEPKAENTRVEITCTEQEALSINGQMLGPELLFKEGRGVDGCRSLRVRF